MPKHTLTDIEREHIAAYGDRLGELLHSCADHQQHDPEVFLWNARRAMEAMCLLLLVANRAPPNKTGREDNSLEAMIQALKGARVLDEQNANRFHSIRTQTNLGVHIRQPEREDYPTAVTDLSHLLPSAVLWVIESQGIGELLRNSAEITNACRLIRTGGRPQTLSAEETAHWKALHEAEQAEHQRTQQRLESAESALDEALHKLGVARAAQLPRAATPKRTQGKVRRPLTILLVSLVVGLTVAATASVVRSQRAPMSQIKGLVPLPDQPPPIKVASLAATPEAASPATASLATTAIPASADPVCPDGMLYVGERTVQLGQPVPDRAGWPKPTKSTLAPTRVPGFCVDLAPRTRTQFAAWPPSAGLSTEACDWRTRGGKGESRPVSCVKHSTAADYCASQVPNGRLPSIPEWEALVRSVPNLVQSGVRREWAADTFPPAIFKRGAGKCEGPACGGGMFWQPLPAQSPPLSPDGNVLLGWYNQEPYKMWSDLGFRCASDPISGD